MPLLVWLLDFKCLMVSLYLVLQHTHNHFTALWILSETTWVNQYQKKHSPTHIYCGHQSSLICFLHLLQSMASSLNLRAWLSTISKFSLVYLLAWHPQLHTPYISSPNHCLLFAAHAHTIKTWFAVVPRLCHLILVFQPYTWYYSKTGCDGMGMCCEKKTMIGWRNVWSMKWRVPGQEVV